MNRKVAILGPGLNSLFPHVSYAEHLELDGLPVSCGLITIPKSSYLRYLEHNPASVLIRVIGFSCNYRDKAGLMRMAASSPPFAYYVLGSEFVGEIVDVGRDVQTLKPGDRVIGNSNYPWIEGAKVPGGIPTVSASSEWLLLRHSQVIKIPEKMLNEQAAAFSLGAQTSYSIIRKLSPQPGQNILITAGRSNTSLFLLSALKKENVNIYVTTSGEIGHEQLKGLGAKEVIRVRRNDPESLLAINETARQIGGFNAIVDPFVDIHLPYLIQLLTFGGRYLTCGMLQTFGSLKPNGYSTTLWEQTLFTLIVKNVSLIGNCLGTTQDIQSAIEDYEQDALQVVLDSVFSESQPAAFIKRTFGQKDRFGKVVCLYS